MPKKKDYEIEALENALSGVRKDGSSIRSMSKKWGIPKSTLERYLKNPPAKRTFGPEPILSSEEEALLVKWVIEMAEKGFPRKAENIRISVKHFLDKNPRPNPFKENLPGPGWMKGFLKRHPTLVQTKTGGSCISELEIRNWFKAIHNYFEYKNLTEILQDPTRIFNADETEFYLCPLSGEVLAAKGSQNSLTIKTNSKECMTVMYSFSASGQSCPPMIVYPYNRLQEKIILSLPTDWASGQSNNGSMTAELFYDYVKNAFSPMLTKANIKRPVILFIDGQKSHVTYQLSELCTELNIELIALYPNATRILQPDDTVGFLPIKQAWKNELMKWMIDCPDIPVNKQIFAGVLKNAIEKDVIPENMSNGFRVTGLFPFNPDAIDFSKCLPKIKNHISDIYDTHTMVYDYVECMYK